MRRRFLRGTAASLLALSVAALPAAAAARPQQIDIAAGNAAEALTRFGEQADVSIVYSYAVVSKYRTKAVQGNVEPLEALHRMLEGTGLVAVQVSPNVFAVQVKGEAPAQDPAGAGRKPAASSSGAQDQAPGVLSGTVVDVLTRGHLKGAFVTIRETGQTAATDDLGTFRFPSVAPGDYSVAVSYLGYVERIFHITVSSGATAYKEVPLLGGSKENVIFVYGSRSARAQALNRERSAENVSTVISGDLLGDFTGTTLSESLRRAPAVVFDRDPLTGEGANIGIRGLAPDMNMVTFNGIELPEGSGTGRSASLANILTESISSVTISKTLLPNQDSAGTGGLVEITTKTPLDRPHRYVSATVEGARRAKGFNNDFLASGTVSGTFGDHDQFGLSASLQYREKKQRRVSYRLSTQEGLYLPLQVDGTASITSSAQVNPLLAFPFEDGDDQVYTTGITINEADNESKNLGLTLSAAWAVSDATKLFFDYQRLSKRSEDYSTNLGLTTYMTYSLQSVAALGGEKRRALKPLLSGLVFAGSYYSYAPDSKNDSDIFTFRGESGLGPLTLKYSAGYTKGRTSTENYNFILASKTSILTADELLPEATDAVENRVISIFPQRMPGDSSFVDPLLTQAGFDTLNNLSNYTVSQIGHYKTIGENSRLKGDFSARYDFDAGIIKYLEFGAKYESSKYSDAKVYEDYYYAVGTQPLDNYGLVPTASSLAAVGVSTQMKQLPQADAINFMTSTVPGLGVECAANACPAGTAFRIYHDPEVDDDRLRDEYTKEGELAAYVQGALHTGRLEVIGGVRMSRVKVDSANLSGPHVYGVDSAEDIDFYYDYSGILREEATVTSFLPRVLANYRYNRNVVFRLGYFLSVARPQISLLSSTPSLLLFLKPTSGPDSNQPFLQVLKGNPGLKPAETHNFDFSAEFYDRHAGVLKLGAFYKQIHNMLESNYENGEGALSDVADLLPDDPRFQDVIANPSAYYISVRLPENAKSPARIWGIEASVEKQFTFLPGVLSGLGVYANYTYTNSSKKQKINWAYSPVLDDDGNVTGYENVTLTVPDVRFNGQAKNSGSLGLTYNKYGIDANVAYTWQGRRQTAFGDNNLGTYEEAYGTLDMRVEYRFDLGPSKARFYVEGSDLLRSVSDSALASTIGADDGVTPKYYVGGTYYGGREIRVGLSASF